MQLEFTEDAIEALADGAYRVNQSTQNIGARRLYTMLDRLLEEGSFEAPDMKMGKVVVNAAYVSDRLAAITEDEDLTRLKNEERRCRDCFEWSKTYCSEPCLGTK